MKRVETNAFESCNKISTGFWSGLSKPRQKKMIAASYCFLAWLEAGYTILNFESSQHQSNSSCFNNVFFFTVSPFLLLNHTKYILEASGSSFTGYLIVQICLRFAINKILVQKLIAAQFFFSLFLEKTELPSL